MAVTESPSSGIPETPVRVLLPQVVPALVVGVAASLLFLGISAAAEELRDVL
ncbi:hypothetical protein ACF06X_30755 [Streptomyces sp. NPDC015346]|uniref:hypothetical protein n=1 Tax=Streptomyces sp. NPDC015346 TaxID=3364954 RepID=UPI003701CFC8